MVIPGHLKKSPPRNAHCFALYKEDRKKTRDPFRKDNDIGSTAGNFLIGKGQMGHLAQRTLHSDELWRVPQKFDHLP